MKKMNHLAVLFWFLNRQQYTALRKSIIMANQIGFTDVIVVWIGLFTLRFLKSFGNIMQSQSSGSEDGSLPCHCKFHEHDGSWLKTLNSVVDRHHCISSHYSS